MPAGPARRAALAPEWCSAGSGGEPEGGEGLCNSLYFNVASLQNAAQFVVYTSASGAGAPVMSMKRSSGRNAEARVFHADDVGLDGGVSRL
jgi:hypothetical protein